MSNYIECTKQKLRYSLQHNSHTGMVLEETFYPAMYTHPLKKMVGQIEHDSGCKMLLIQNTDIVACIQFYGTKDAVRTAQELVQKNVLTDDESRGSVPDASQEAPMVPLAAPTVLRHTQELSAAISLSESNVPAHFSKLQLDDPHAFAVAEEPEPEPEYPPIWSKPASFSMPELNDLRELSGLSCHTSEAGIEDDSKTARSSARSRRRQLQAWQRMAKLTEQKTECMPDGADREEGLNSDVYRHQSKSLEYSTFLERASSWQMGDQPKIPLRGQEPERKTSNEVQKGLQMLGLRRLQDLNDSFNSRVSDSFNSQNSAMPQLPILRQPDHWSVQMEQIVQDIHQAAVRADYIAAILRDVVHHNIDLPILIEKLTSSSPQQNAPPWMTGQS